MSPKLYTYRCALEHTYQDYGPFEVSMMHPADGRLTSGPICPTCFVKWVHDNVGALEKVEEPIVKEPAIAGPRKEQPRGTKRIRKHSE